MSSIDKLLEKLQFLRSELVMRRSDNRVAQMDERISEKYKTNLSNFLRTYEDSASELASLKAIITDKVTKLNVQFGEYPETDSCIVFYTLHEFLVALTNVQSDE